MDLCFGAVSLLVVENGLNIKKSQPVGGTNCFKTAEMFKPQI